MLIIWLQGIWLPLHGYNYSDDPAVGGHLPAAAHGRLPRSPDRSRATSRTATEHASSRRRDSVVFAASFVGLLLVPTNFSYWVFALLIFANGVGGGMFSAPNQAAVMNSVPADQRGGAAGIQAAFMNTGMVLSIGIFFSLMIVGLTNTLPKVDVQGTSQPTASARPRRTPWRTCRPSAASSRRSSASTRSRACSEPSRRPT